MSTVEKYWDDAQEGDEAITPSYTVTKQRILAYADLTGDHTPVHVDEEYAKASHFGGLVAHGLMGLSIADGLKTQCEYRFLPGMSLGWTWDFLLPIRVDDVLHVKMRVGAMRASKSKPGWGIVVLPSELINQKGEVVQRGEHRLMVPRREARV
nr:MaoC family dehydratase [Pseudomonas sp.]